MRDEEIFEKDIRERMNSKLSSTEEVLSVLSVKNSFEFLQTLHCLSMSIDYQALQTGKETTYLNENAAVILAGEKV